MTDPAPLRVTDSDLFRSRPEWATGVPSEPPAIMRETEQDKAEREAMARVHRERRWLRRLPKRYAEAMPADLHAEEQSRRLVGAWLDMDHRTLLLASAKPGLGKTHAAYAVGNFAVRHRGLWAEGWTTMELLAALRPNHRDPDEPSKVLDDVLSCDVLILDDLGRENSTAWAQEQVHHVLDARLREDRRTVITTNLTSEEMGERYGYPLLDRVLDGAVIVKVTGESRRRPAEW